MFCIKCGADAIAENLCEKCYMHGKNLFDVDVPEITYCAVCGRFTVGKDILSASEIKDLISRSVHSDFTIKNVSVSFRHDGSLLRTIFDISIYIMPLKQLHRKKKNMLVRMKKRKCQVCSRISGGYHEAVIQIRGNQREKILDKVDKLLTKDDYAGLEEKKEGYDVKVIDKKKADSVVAWLRKRHEVKTSYKLVGEKKGRKLYRNFYAVW